MRRLLLSGIAFSAIFSTAAIAADLPMYTKAPEPAFVPVFSWTGFYAGLNAGYGFGNDNSAVTSGQSAINSATVADGARAALVGLDPDGFIGGAQIGYNWQFGSFVFGVEADIQYTDFNQTVNAVTVGTAFPGVRNNLYTQELDYLGTVRARLGYAWGRTLIYGTGGLAYGRVNNSANFFGPQPVNALQFTGSERSTETGYAVGGGIEHAFGWNWTLKGEYLYYDLGDTTVAANVIPGSGGVGNGYNVNFQNDGHIIRAGLNYKW